MDYTMNILFIDGTVYSLLSWALLDLISVFFIFYNIVSVLCFGFLDTRLVGYYPPNQG